MMKSGFAPWFGAVAALCLAGSVRAQQGGQAQVVATCGTQAFPLGTSVQPRYAPFTILPSGLLCTNATGGGGGGGGAVYGPTAVGSPPGQPPVYTGGTDPSGNTKGFATDASGRQLVAIGAPGTLELDSTGQAIKTALGSPFQAGGAVGQGAPGTSPWLVNTAQVGGATTSTGNGTVDAGTQRVTDPNNASYGQPGAANIPLVAPGNTITAGRAMKVRCPATNAPGANAAPVPGTGYVVLTLASGQTVQQEIANGGAYLAPYAVTQVGNQVVETGTLATCTYQNVN